MADNPYQHLASELPEAVLLKTRHAGAAGVRWRENLPDMVAQLAARWSLTVGRVLTGGSESLILAVVLPDGTDAVIKLGLPPDCDCSREAHVLRISAGAGYVRLIDHDAAANALLLERLGDSLASSRLPVHQQLEILCHHIKSAWQPMASAEGLMTGGEKAAWLADFISAAWRDLNSPCPASTVEAALEFCAERVAAFEPGASVLVHGDAHAHNLLYNLSGRGLKLVDPDGLFAEPACDLAVPMRDWSEELLAGDTVALGQTRCMMIATLTDVDPGAIWQWGFMERVSTGLLLLQIGMMQEGQASLAVADAWAGVEPPA